MCFGWYFKFEANFELNFGFSRFIKPKMPHDDHQPTEHIPSPLFDAVLPTEQQICDHTQSCDSHLYQVSKILNNLRQVVEMLFVVRIFFRER